MWGKWLSVYMRGPGRHGMPAQLNGATRVMHATQSGVEYLQELRQAQHEGKRILLPKVTQGVVSAMRPHFNLLSGLLQCPADTVII